MVLTVLTEELVDAIISKYGKLKKLNLSNNGLQSIEHIEKLSNLMKVNLSCNEIENLEPLSYCTLLVELDLHDNKMFVTSFYLQSILIS